jgi:3-oxoacyl-[acyl-carrier protein] reductase
MNLHLSGLTAVVTGGSSGIGAAIVKTLAEEGCNVAFCARGQAKIDQRLEELKNLPGKVMARAIDARNKADMTEWFADIGAFDIFIPNISALSEEWDEAIATDISATVMATQAAIPYLKKSAHAALTYVGSKASSLPAPNSAAYGAAKAAMAHYMKSIAVQYLPSIRVNTVSPGDTLFEGGLWSTVRDAEPEKYHQVELRNPLGRLARAEEIARVVAFISSPAASFVAGANWYVDGGSTQHVQF